MKYTVIVTLILIGIASGILTSKYIDWKNKEWRVINIAPTYKKQLKDNGNVRPRFISKRDYDDALVKMGLDPNDNYIEKEVGISFRVKGEQANKTISCVGLNKDGEKVFTKESIFFKLPPYTDVKINGVFSKDINKINCYTIR